MEEQDKEQIKELEKQGREEAAVDGGDELLGGGELGPGGGGGGEGPSRIGTGSSLRAARKAV